MYRLYCLGGLVVLLCGCLVKGCSFCVCVCLFAVLPDTLVCGLLFVIGCLFVAVC